MRYAFATTHCVALSLALTTCLVVSGMAGPALGQEINHLPRNPVPSETAPVYPHPVPLSELEESADREVIAYSILMLSGESAAVETFAVAQFESWPGEAGQFAVWYRSEPVAADICQLATEAGLTGEQPTLVCRSGSGCEFLSGGEVPLTRGWKVNQRGIAVPVVEFESFGFSMQIKPRTPDDGKLVTDLIIEDRQLSGTKKSTVPTPDGGEFTIDVPQFDFVRRINTGCRLEPGQSMVMRYTVAEENRMKVLVISPRILDQSANEESASTDALHKFSDQSTPQPSEPAARLAREVTGPKALKPDRQKWR